jgi:peptidyl-prolyl cis-trans isomerase B (cyclophilin B)
MAGYDSRTIRHDHHLDGRFLKYHELRRSGPLAGKKDRQRRRARERFERQAEARAVRQNKIRKRTGIGALACVVAGLIALGVVLVTGGSGKSSAASKPTSTPTPTASASATPTPSTIAEPAHHCTYTSDPPAARTVSFPSATPDYTAKYEATINTNRGAIVINLLNAKATCTVNSFVHLAESSYWANSQCHRVSNSGGLYMVQCGDPYATATTKLTCSETSKVGTGGPGYEFESENLTDAKYPAGTLAMANDGSADSNGGQFFLVYKDTDLPADYTPFGTITSGLDILQNVANSGYTCQYSAGGGAPKEKLIIDSVSIKKL